MTGCGAANEDLLDGGVEPRCELGVPELRRVIFRCASVGRADVGKVDMLDFDESVCVRAFDSECCEMGSKAALRFSGGESREGVL